MPDSTVSLPLPDDPALAVWASALNDAGYWAQILDARWRLVFTTDELLLTYREMGASTAVPIGSHFFSAEASQFRASAFGRGTNTRPELRRAAFLRTGRYVLATTPGGREELRRVVDPALVDLVDELEPLDVPVVWIARLAWTTAGADVTGAALFVRLDDSDGRVAGFGILSKPAAGMSHFGAAAAVAD